MSNALIRSLCSFRIGRAFRAFRQLASFCLEHATPTLQGKGPPCPILGYFDLGSPRRACNAWVLRLRTEALAKTAGFYGHSKTAAGFGQAGLSQRPFQKSPHQGRDSEKRTKRLCFSWHLCRFSRCLRGSFGMLRDNPCAISAALVWGVGVMKPLRLKAAVVDSSRFFRRYQACILGQGNASTEATRPCL